MKTDEAIKLAGGKAASLAAILGITPAAVSQWDENVPDRRVWQLRVLRPEWFRQNSGVPELIPQGAPTTEQGVANA